MFSAKMLTANISINNNSYPLLARKIRVHLE